MNFVWWKAMAALALAPLALDGPRHRLEAVFKGHSRAVLVGVFAGSRLVGCAFAFLVLDLALPSDVRGYYTAFAEAVLNAGRSDRSPYSPGFDYLLAALRWWWASSLSFVVLMMVAEIAAVVLVLRLLDRHRPALSLPIAVLWLVSPVSLLHVAIGGQDEALVLLVWSVVASLAVGGRAVAAGMTIVVGLASTKVLALFAALPFAGTSHERIWRVVATCLVLGGLLAAALHALGVPLGDVVAESRLATSGNLWALPAIALGWGRPVPMLGAMLVGTAVLAAALVYMHVRPWPASADQVLRVTGTIGCLFLLLGQKSFANYLVIFLPGVLFLALQVSSAERVFLLSVVLPVSAFEPSLWFYFAEGEALVGSAAGRLVMLAADLVLVLGYALLVRRGLRPARWRHDAVAA